MKKATLNWLQSAEYDLKSAAALFSAKRYIYVVFLCHLAIEKTLKAVLAETTGDMPPYTHNLNKLLDLAGIKLPEEHRAFMDKVNLQSVPTRYPEDFNQISKELGKETVSDFLKSTRGLIRWLKRNTPALRSDA